MPLAINLVAIAVTPALFWYLGKRFLGEQTHPAALFTLAWFALLFQLPVTSDFSQFAPVALLWVALNFGIFAFIKKLRKKSANPTVEKTAAPEDPPSP